MHASPAWSVYSVELTLPACYARIDAVAEDSYDRTSVSTSPSLRPSHSVVGA